MRVKSNWPAVSTLLPIMLVLSGCTPIEGVVPTLEGAVYAPTVVPTEAPPAPPADQTAVAAEATRFATQFAGEQAAIITRATADPFPTAQAVRTESGQPSLTTARRGGLSVEVRLSRGSYLAGEGGQAEVTLRNDGPELVFVTGGRDSLFTAVLLDEQGQEPDPWPWPPVSMPGMPRLAELGPGQTLTETVIFQVPPFEASVAPSFTLWLETRFSRASPANQAGPDNVWLRLEAGPIPVQLHAPTADQWLQATLNADHSGWNLRVTNAAGQVPVGPLSGALEAATFSSLHARPLRESAAGTWSATWDQDSYSEGQITVRAWVAAPGYVTAAVTQTVPGTGDARNLFDTGSELQIQTYPTFEAAQAALDIPLFRLGDLPAGTTLESIQVESSADRDARWVTVRQIYRLPDGARLELAQFYTNQQYDSAGWGQARYNAEARAASVGGQPAYLVQRFGWWSLDWKIGNDGFELRVPVEALPASGVMALAEGVRP